MNKRYYHIYTTPKSADIYIYGDITSWPWMDDDVSAAPIVNEIDSLMVDEINVYINSYGGEVAEALAIISALDRNQAKVHTYCDGFACSAAVNIFMAGDERIMSPGSLLMVHNAWMGARGNSTELHKAADDLSKINEATLEAYIRKVAIPESELRSLFDAETWLGAAEALEKGFATSLVDAPTSKAVSQNVRDVVARRLTEKVPRMELLVKDMPEIMTGLSQRVDDVIAKALIQPDPAPEPAPAQNDSKARRMFEALFREEKESE